MITLLEAVTLTYVEGYALIRELLGFHLLMESLLLLLLLWLSV